MTTTTFSVIGKSIERYDGPVKVSGAARYSADYAPPGTLWVRALRSPFAHAKIKSINVEKALKIPGVHGALTARDFKGVLGGFTFRDQPVLADGKVRFIGEKVAAVCADTEEIAEEALALIEVEYEDIPAVFDAVDAMKADAPLVHDKINGYVGLPNPAKDGTNILAFRTYGKGDVQQGFKLSDRIFEHSFTTQIQHQGYIEPTACMVEIKDGKVNVYAANKSPSSLRRQISEVIGLPLDQINIMPVVIGGDFGGKRHASDIPLCYMFAKATGKPVKSIMDYAEELTAGNPRHPSTIKMKTGVSNDGRILALEAQVVYNGGAYGAYKPGGNVGGAELITGPYKIPNTKVDSYMVYTNTVPGGYMRAPGAPQAAWAGESNIDMIARTLGIDPAEMRRKNVLHRGDESATGHHYRDANADDYLERALKESGYFAPKKKGVGRGIALSDWHVGAFDALVTIAVTTDGFVTVKNTKPEVGTTLLTITEMIAAEELGLPIEKIKTLPSTPEEYNTERGIGGSTGMKSTGVTTIKAAGLLKEKLKQVAVSHLGWNAADLSFSKGSIVNDKTKESATIFELARKQGSAIEVSTTMGQIERAEAAVFCCQVVEVEVDAETGHVKLTKITSVHDAGRVLHPVVYEGQVDGGIVQGIGFAMMEHLKIEDGKPVTTTLGDYKLPTIIDIPEINRVIVESDDQSLIYGPYGAKNVGESSCIGVAPAIANAIQDAVGARVTDLPISSESVFKDLKSKNGKH